MSTITTDSGRTNPAKASTITAFDSARRAHSAEEGQPAERMAAPSCLRRDSIDPSGSFVVPFWLSKSGLMVEFPGQTERRASVADIDGAYRAPQYVAMPVDRAALKAMIALCAKAGDEHQAIARLLDFSQRMPLSSNLVVLTEVLTRKFWIQPDLDASSIKDWRTAFKLAYSTASLRWLAGQVFNEAGMTGKQSVYRKNMFEAEDRANDKVVHWGAANAMAVYEASNSVSETWGAYERIDTTLRYRYLVTGEVARATPISVHGTMVVCALSTPFKVREGEVLVTDEGDEGQVVRPVQLAALGYEDRLIGSFTGAKSNSKRRVSDGLPTMLAAHAARDSVLITGSPFMGVGSFTPSVKRWTTRDEAEQAPRVERDVPLDVSLAGAPSGN